MNFSKSSCILIILLTAFTLSTLIPSTSHSQTRGSPSVAPARPLSGSKPNSPTYRLMANYDYIMTNPSDLNNFNKGIVWNGTTQVQNSFSNLNGFTIGFGYLIGNGYLGFEYSLASQQLPSTTIIPTSQTIQNTLDYQPLYISYDWLFSQGPKQSYELGGGLGYAMKYQYHWLLSNAGTTEEVIWQANPILFKVRANYNYHFSNNIRIRLGAAYEYATSSSLKADSSHPTLGVTSGQNLRWAGGQDVKVDMSGFRLNAGLVVAF